MTIVSKISVVIPACDEADTVAEVVTSVFETLDSETEVIVVDDGSHDATAEEARRAGARVLRNPYTMGNGASVKRGIRSAMGDVIVLLDADGQHAPSDISALLAHIPRYAMAIGQRTCRQDWPRAFANAVYNLLASYVTGMPIKDLTSGFRAFKREAALKFLYLLPNRFSYPTTLTLSFIKAGYPIRFVPIAARRRKKGVSKIRLVPDGLRFFVIIAKISIFFSPLRIFLPLSASFLFTGLGYYIYTYIHAHRFTNMSALLLTTSVIILMLGFVSEQIANLRMEKTGE